MKVLIGVQRKRHSHSLTEIQIGTLQRVSCRRDVRALQKRVCLAGTKSARRRKLLLESNHFMSKVYKGTMYFGLQVFGKILSPGDFEMLDYDLKTPTALL
ncbi:hypothetical protein CUMW_219670 [Citrus unshiu]|uniref:Uncharacterized protein n=1 Tax=Citrus unshiu TaxID=55188 RepID=A0A2H5QDE5_CITUN|nr:hypothetical protein CUMW_219670 [Citrus unshiu]